MDTYRLVMALNNMKCVYNESKDLNKLNETYDFYKKDTPEWKFSIENWYKYGLKFIEVFNVFPPVDNYSLYFGCMMLDLFKLNDLLCVPKDVSLKEFVLKKFGQKGVDLIELDLNKEEGL